MIYTTTSCFLVVDIKILSCIFCVLMLAWGCCCVLF